jgi:hypothetical protein
MMEKGREGRRGPGIEGEKERGVRESKHSLTAVPYDP